MHTLTYGQKLIAEAIEAHFGERIENYDEDVDDTSNHDAWEAFDAIAALSQSAALAGQEGATGWAGFAAWCDQQRALLGAVDGYNYSSGEEYGLRRAQIEAERRAALSPSPAGVQVKALKWAKYGVPKSAAFQQVEDIWYTNPSEYCITKCRSGFFTWVAAGLWGPESNSDFAKALKANRVAINNTLEAAQAYAEAHREHRIRSALIDPPAAGVQSVPIPGLSAWEGWDRSRGDWSETKHKDAVCATVFGPTWSVEDCAALIGFIERTWTRRPAVSLALEEQRNDG